MAVELADLKAFVIVARAGGFREGARASGGSASGLSDAVRRLETQLGVRLLHRTTRSVAVTEAGQGLWDRLAPALSEMEAALDVVNGYRDRPAGVLRLNVPVSAARLVLPKIVPGFMAAYPEIRMELTVEDSFVDVLASGCDAGILYDERLAQDMIAVPIGPRVQRFAAAASKDYLDRHGRPAHPRELVNHLCIRNRFASGTMPDWEFERDGETLVIDPPAALIVQTGGGVDLGVECTIAGGGILCLFEDWLRPYFERGLLEPVLADWWPSFSGPFLYYSGRRLVPAPLRAFIDFIKAGAPA